MAAEATFTIGPGPDKFLVPTWLQEMDLSKGAKLVYVVLRTCSRGRSYVWPRLDYLASRVSASVRTVQRHINELVAHGLVEKGKEKLWGKLRQVYRFLGTPKAPAAKPPLPGVASSDNHYIASSDDMTKCPVPGDNLSPPYLTYESKAMEEEPPMPPSELPKPKASGDQASPTGEAVVDPATPLEEEIAAEDPVWTQAKTEMGQTLSEGTMANWIRPLKFSQNGPKAILRAPNKFFGSWAKSHFGQDIAEALAQAGVTDVSYELYTPEEQQRQEELERAREMEKAQKRPAPHKAPNVDTLPLDGQFQALYQAYPRQEGHEKGWQVFRQLRESHDLPGTSSLITAVKAARANKESWQREGGRFVPWLHNWLRKQGWKD